jgi:ubiquinone/menaquinone biosynthesis C-methylase UbiE
MSFLDLFSDKASLYASARPRYPEDLFAFVSSQAPSHNCAWDCGAGNGQAAASLSKHFLKVFASDPSNEQIANAIPADNVYYSVQRAEQTSFPDHSFDAVCVAQALHWFDFDVFFTELRRVAAPGAIFAAWGYDWFSVSPAFDATFKTSVLDVIEPYWASQNQILWRGYADVPIPFPRIATPTFKIEAHWSLYELLAYVHSWSATRRCISAMGTGFFESAQCQLAPLWGEAESRRCISMPLHLVVGRVS